MQNLRGYRILCISLYPVSYFPSKREIVYFENLTVTIKTLAAEIAPGFRGLARDSQLVAKYVDNPDMLVSYPVKIDLDLTNKNYAIKLLTERLKFLSDVNILPFKYITDISLIKKSNYSVRINLKKELQPEVLILFQSMLGDDFKRTAITFRDYKLEIRNYNRLFDTKRYVSGDYKNATTESIFKLVKNKICKPKSENFLNF